MWLVLRRRSEPRRVGRRGWRRLGQGTERWRRGGAGESGAEEGGEGGPGAAGRVGLDEGGPAETLARREPGWTQARDPGWIQHQIVWVKIGGPGGGEGGGEPGHERVERFGRDLPRCGLKRRVHPQGHAGPGLVHLGAGEDRQEGRVWIRLVVRPGFACARAKRHVARERHHHHWLAGLDVFGAPGAAQRTGLQRGPDPVSIEDHPAGSNEPSRVVAQVGSPQESATQQDTWSDQAGGSTRWSSAWSEPASFQ